MNDNVYIRVGHRIVEFPNPQESPNELVTRVGGKLADKKAYKQFLSQQKTDPLTELQKEIKLLRKRVEKLEAR